MADEGGLDASAGFLLMRRTMADVGGRRDAAEANRSVPAGPYRGSTISRSGVPKSARSAMMPVRPERCEAG